MKSDPNPQMSFLYLCGFVCHLRLPMTSDKAHLSEQKPRPGADVIALFSVFFCYRRAFSSTIESDLAVNVDLY